MILKSRPPKGKTFKNRFFLWLTIYFSLLIFICILLAAFFSFQQKKTEVMSSVKLIYTNLSKAYEATIDNFWELYLPIIENPEDYEVAWTPYFDIENYPILDAFSRIELENSMKLIKRQNNTIEWIVLYNPKREDNYIFFVNSGMKLLPADFPYLEQLQAPSKSMQIFGKETMWHNQLRYDTFAIAGGIPSQIGNGRLLVGFNMNDFDRSCLNSPSVLDNINYVLTNHGEIIFDYSGKYDTAHTFCAKEPLTEATISFQGEKIYASSKKCGINSSMVCFYFPLKDMFFLCHQYTPIFLILLGIFFISIFLLYRMKVNMDKATYYKKMQHETALSDLQSRFNPHFLYNNLEVLRSRCQLNGDEVTADLITQLATIFRGFLNMKLFIPLTDELAFSKRYLILFGANHKNQFSFRYNFDKEILHYGIISNVFQPLIENYFVHGFDEENEENYIVFSGKSIDKNTMLLKMEDNGLGMSPEQIRQLQDKLGQPIQNTSESYGLKNLQQRLQLFYGDDYGLSIIPSTLGPKGLCIQILVPKITCEEYKNKYQTF